VKVASSGQLIRRWYRDWKPPAGEGLTGGGRNGELYDQLMAEVRKATGGKPRPESVTFVWMQGEADTDNPKYVDLYADALNGLLRQLETDLDRKDLYLVLGRINNSGSKGERRDSWEKMRQLQVKLAGDHPRGGWVDTDDLNGKIDDAHLTPANYRTLGERFARNSVELLQGTSK
jgi:hypothetical protein